VTCAETGIIPCALCRAYLLLLAAATAPGHNLHLVWCTKPQAVAQAYTNMGWPQKYIHGQSPPLQLAGAANMNINMATTSAVINNMRHEKNVPRGNLTLCNSCCQQRMQMCCLCCASLHHKGHQLVVVQGPNQVAHAAQVIPGLHITKRAHRMSTPTPMHAEAPCTCG